MNNQILIGIIIIAIGGALGTYFIQLGRSKLAKGNTKVVTDKVDQASKNSQKRDTETTALIEESTGTILEAIKLSDAKKEEIKQHYLSQLKEKEKKLKLAEDKINELLVAQEALTSEDNLLKEAFELFNKKDIDKAIAHIENNLINTNRQKLEEYYLITSNMYFTKLDVENGTKYLELYVSENPNFEKYGKAANVLRKLNLLDKSSSYLSKAISIAETNNINNYDKEHLAAMYSFSGTVKIQTGKPLEGAEHLIMAQSLYDKLDGHEKDKIGIMMNLATLSFNIGDTDRALEQFHKAENEMKIYENSEEIYEVSQMADLYQNISNTYREQKNDLEMAEKYNNKCLSTIQRVNDFLTVPLFSKNLVNYSYINGLIAQKRGNFKKANKDLKEAADSCKVFSKYEPLAYDSILAKIYRAHGELNIEEDKISEGMELLENSKNIYVSLNKLEPGRYQLAINKITEIIERIE